MYITGANGLTRFVVRHSPEAQRVLLAGSFTHWKLIPMTRRGDGSFSATVRLPAGAHEYKFIVNGMWCTDADNDMSVPNPHGSENSLALVLRVSPQDKPRRHPDGEWSA